MRQATVTEMRNDWIATQFEGPRNPERQAILSASPAPTTADGSRGAEWLLIRRALAGDAGAQEQLFAPYMSRLFQTAFGVLRNKEDAEDALQDGLCKAYTNLAAFEGRSSFCTWLTRIVINEALMARRRNIAHPEPSLDEMIDNQSQRLAVCAVESRPDPERVCAAAEIREVLERRVRELPSRLEAAYRLGAHGLSTRESSRALGISKTAYKSRVARARQKVASGLRGLLEPGGSRFVSLRPVARAGKDAVAA